MGWTSAAWAYNQCMCEGALHAWWRCMHCDDMCKPIWNVWNLTTPECRSLHVCGNTQCEQADLLLLTDKNHSGQYLLVSQLGEAHNSTATLDWLDDLGGLVAGQSKPGSIAVDLHGPPQGLLCPTCHAARHTCSFCIHLPTSEAHTHPNAAEPHSRPVTVAARTGGTTMYHKA